MTLFALAMLDYAVVGVYLVGMLWLGAVFSRRQTSSDEYFLAGRNIPWFAVGLSVIATLMSSLTYVSEPGEVWKSGVTNMAGKMLAIPFEMLLVWLVVIPFLTRFRYTSAYDYLGERFGGATKWLGIGLFLWYAVSWMGFIVLASSRIMSAAAEQDLYLAIAVVGLVATIYTVAGGLRAVIWTDVVQVVLMLGGAIMTLVYVGLQTGSTPSDWYDAVVRRSVKSLDFFDLNPFTRSTIFTVACSMFVWHVSTHMGNQMTAQRYFAAGSTRAARRSFVVGSLAGVAINLLLLAVGLALFFYYDYLGQTRPEGMDPSGKDADMIFPLFAMHRLPAGLAGAWLAAMLAAAMSSIDSGINSAASVLTVEWHRRYPHDREEATGGGLRGAKLLTLALGLSITLAAFGLDVLTRERNIIEMMSRSFNCFTGPLGGIFLLGMFARRVGDRAAFTAGVVGLATSLGIAYGRELFGLAQSISFTWVQPCSLLATLTAGVVLAPFERRRPATNPDLLWRGGASADDASLR